MGWTAHLTKDIKEGLRPVVDLVYPPRCPSCGASTANHGALCLECWGELEFPESKHGDALTQTTGQSEIIAATLYNEMSRGLILKFKHGGKLALAPLLGRMMASRIHNDDDVLPAIIPVPLHPTRIWHRGFNQAAMLARELAKAGKGTLQVDALVRQKRTPSLGTMNAEERERALHGAIAVRDNARAGIKGKDVILVDDVVTSGATSGACVQALLDAGASSVRIACFALAHR